jgi:RNA polymerase sigma factor (sigma-70 family)
VQAKTKTITSDELVIQGIFASQNRFLLRQRYLIKKNPWGWLVDGESRRGRGPLSAWRVSLPEPLNPKDLEATGHRISPPIQEYNGNHLESSVPYPDRIPLTEDQRGLAIRYLPMARHLAQRLCAIWPDKRDELESTAYLALAEAAQSFDSSRKVGFGTFARHRIRAALRDFQRLLSLDGWQGTGEAGAVRTELRRFHDRIGRTIEIDPEQPVGAETLEAKAVDDWLRLLPQVHATVCRLIYQWGKSEDEVATELGWSKPVLARMHREAVTGLIRAYHLARLAYPQDSSKATD